MKNKVQSEVINDNENSLVSIIILHDKGKSLIIHLNRRTNSLLNIRLLYWSIYYLKELYLHPCLIWSNFGYWVYCNHLSEVQCHKPCCACIATLTWVDFWKVLFFSNKYTHFHFVIFDIDSTSITEISQTTLVKKMYPSKSAVISPKYLFDIHSVTVMYTLNTFSWT